MADIYVVLLLALGSFIGIVAASTVLMFVWTRESVVKWFFKRSLELANEMTAELEQD